MSYIIHLPCNLLNISLVGERSIVGGNSIRKHVNPPPLIDSKMKPSSTSSWLFNSLPLLLEWFNHLACLSWAKRRSRVKDNLIHLNLPFYSITHMNYLIFNLSYFLMRQDNTCVNYPKIQGRRIGHFKITSMMWGVRKNSNCKLKPLPIT